MSSVSSSFGDFQGSGFHVPVLGLFADFEKASGHVALPDDFMDSPAEVRLRVIDQWQMGFNARKDEALVQMFRDFARPLCNLSIVVQVERFKKHCLVRGISCPDDLAVMLQRY